MSASRARHWWNRTRSRSFAVNLPQALLACGTSSHLPLQGRGCDVQNTMAAPGSAASSWAVTTFWIIAALTVVSLAAVCCSQDTVICVSSLSWRFHWRFVVSVDTRPPSATCLPSTKETSAFSRCVNFRERGDKKYVSSERLSQRAATVKVCDIVQRAQLICR